MKTSTTILTSIFLFLVLTQTAAQRLVLRDILYNAKPGYNPAIVSKADASSGEFMFRTYYPPKKCNEKYRFSWTFDRDMTVIEYPDNQTIKVRINMFAKLDGLSCQENRNPFMTRSGSGQSPSRIISTTKYAGNIVNGIENLSKRVMARDYNLGGNNYRSLRDEMEIRLAYNPEYDGQYVYFYFNITGKMDSKKPGSIEYEVLYVYEVNGKIDNAGTCLAPKISEFKIEQITSNSVSLVNTSDEQSIKWRYRTNGSGSWTEILGYFTKEYVAGLKPGTTYEVQMKKWCEIQNKYSSWSKSKTFTTKSAQANCKPPKIHEMKVTKITSTSAQLTVTSLHNYIKWSYRRVGSSTWISLGTTSGKQRDLKDLTPSTNYEFRTSVICGNTVSAFSSAKSFKTLPIVCDAATEDQIKLVTATSYSATVKVESQQSYFRWAIRKYGSSDWDLDNYSWDNEILLSGLDAGTNYVVHVKVKCNDMWSKWSSPGFILRTKQNDCKAPFSSELSSSTGSDWALISISTNQAKVDFEYRQKSGVTIQISASTSKKKQLENLKPQTDYEFRARVLCNSIWSSWSSWKPFRTKAEDCRTPELSDLAVTNITEEAATLKVRTSKEVEWRFREAGSTWKSFTGFTISDGEYKHISKGSLSPGIDYEFSVRIRCNGTWTSWSAPYPFHNSECQIIQPDLVNVTNIGKNKVTIEIRQSFQTGFVQLLDGASLHDIGIISTNSFVISDLKPGTDYSLFLSTNCSFSCNYSDAAKIDFRTQSSNNSRRQQEDTSRSKDAEPISPIDITNTTEEDQTSFLIYPNPTAESFQFRGMQEVRQLNIINVQGQTVYITSRIEEGNHINVHKLPAGSYHVVAIDENGARGISKLNIVK